MGRLFCLCVFLAASIGAASAQPLGMKEQGGIRYGCGGIGAEGRAELEPLRKQANVELIFSTGKRSAYVADVAVSVFGADAAPRAKFEADGPICLLFVPIGTYRIDAVHEGVKRERRLKTAARAGRTMLVVFNFPEGHADD